VSLLFTTVAVAASISSLRATPPAVIVQAIDENQRVVLLGNTRGEAGPKFDAGRVTDSLPMKGLQLQLKMTPDRAQAAEALVEELQKGDSSQFHQWLTPAQYRDQFGVAPQDIATISAWLTSHGFTVDDPSPSGMIISFSGTAGQVRETFHTEIHALNVKGEHHIANMSDPSIPAALAPAVEGVVALHDFRPKSAIAKRAPQFTFTVDGSLYQGVVPADIATIYNFNPLYASGIDGSGQTIAVIQDTDLYSTADWTTFRSTFGLGKYKKATLTAVHPGRSCSDPGVNSDDYEAILDTEWASAAAPNANIEEVSCANTTTTFGGLIAMQNLLNQPKLPQVISISYAECETQNGATFNAAYNTAYQQAALEGVSVFVCAGDNGADMCADNTGTGPSGDGITVNGIASTAYNVAVGGTDFGDTYAGTNSDYWSNTNGPTYGSALNYIPEIAWNDTCGSSLISDYLGYTTPDSFCATALGGEFTDNLYNNGAGGGGPSNCASGTSATGVANGNCKGRAKPIWQDVLGNPNDGVRDLPDVSLFAGNGIWGHYYILCYSDAANGGSPCVGGPQNWTGVGGTSVATPILAGLQALVNQRWGGSQGNAAPVYYALARMQYGRLGGLESASSNVFHDVTLGDNDVDCLGTVDCYTPFPNDDGGGVLSLSSTQYEAAYGTNKGWSFATGLGSVNATNVVRNDIWQSGWGKYWSLGWGPW
jgi:subtilase family serine protease